LIRTAFHAISLKLLEFFAVTTGIHSSSRLISGNKNWNVKRGVSRRFMRNERISLDKSKFIRVWEVKQTCSLCPTGLGIMIGLFAEAGPANDPFLGFARFLVV
jgi:hypothetical protein